MESLALQPRALLTPTSADLARTVVIGSSGAGKTTLAQQLGSTLGHPVVQLDALYWAPAWKPRADTEFQRLVDEATSGDRWVVDGNYAGVRDVVWPRASTIIWLDFSF